MKTFETITKEMCDLYDKKNTDYGNVFEQSCDEFGYISPVIRLNDKVSRLKHLIQTETVPKCESIEDTLLDIANYAVMTLIWMNR